MQDIEATIREKVEIVTGVDDPARNCANVVGAHRLTFAVHLNDPPRISREEDSM